MTTIFEIMKHLRDLNVLRGITWAIETNPTPSSDVIVVRIPVTGDEVDFVNRLEQLFAPKVRT